jgi:hypothetical protein
MRKINYIDSWLNISHLNLKIIDSFMVYTSIEIVF